MDWFDIDRPGAPTIPGFTDGVCIDSSTGAALDPCPVSGQLHALLLDNDYVDLPGWPDDDDVYIKHYRVSQKCDTQPTQQVSIDPSFLNFDDIPVGGEAQAIIRIRNTGEGAFHIIAAGLNESESSDFSIDLSTTLAVQIDPGESIAISVVIAPTEAGRLNQTIKIETDIPQRNQIVIPLTAQAIGFPRQIERLINDFNQLIGSGALEGSGPGMSSSGRLNAIRNMLSSAERLIGSGEMDAACGKLKNIFRRIDSASPPPDFAKGEETNSFSIELLALADRMKCKWTP